MKNDDIKLMLETHFTATRGMIMAMDDGVNRRFDIIDKSNEKRNHRLEKAEDKIDNLEKIDLKIINDHNNCPARKIGMRMHKKWFWVVAVVLFALVYFILETIYNGTGLGEIIFKLI